MTAAFIGLIAASLAGAMTYAQELKPIRALLCFAICLGTVGLLLWSMSSV